MAEIAKFKPRRRISIADASRLDAQLNGIVANHPSLAGSIGNVRNDIRSQQERPATWKFVMLGPYENAVIVDLIMSNAARPKLSIRLWAIMLCRLQADTGLVNMTRQEMMEAVGTKSSGIISTALAELVDFGALQRDSGQRPPRWFINPKIATHLAEHARTWAQRDAPNVFDIAKETRKRRQPRAEP